MHVPRFFAVLELHSNLPWNTAIDRSQLQLRLACRSKRGDHNIDLGPDASLRGSLRQIGFRREARGKASCRHAGNDSLRGLHQPLWA